MLKPFADGHSLLEFQLIRLKKAFPLSPIVVATTTSSADNEIEDIAIKHEILYYRGDEQDVLGRFVNCCRHFQFTDYIVRICGDNPFLQLEFLATLMREAANSDEADYIGYAINHTPAIRTHFGFFAELVKVSALERADDLVKNPLYREHVTNYIYTQSEENHNFILRWLSIDSLTPYTNSIRLTIDTVADFENAVSVYLGIKGAAGPSGRGKRAFEEADAGNEGGQDRNDSGEEISWKSVIAFVDSHPGTKANMEEQIRLHQK